MISRRSPGQRAWHNRASAMVLAGTLLLSACSDNDNPVDLFLADDADTVIWRLALEEISGSVQDAWAQEFRERIEDISDGNIQVEIYPYGSIGTSVELTRLVEDGRVHLAFASPGHLAGRVPEAGVLVLPFLFPDDDQENRQVLADPELTGLLRDAWQDAGLRLLDLVPEGWIAWTANRPLRSPDHFTGLRMRTMTAPIQAEVFGAWGADPVPLPYSDVYNALQLGRIDGQSNPVFAILEMKFYEVQSVLTQPRATRFVASVITGEDWYQELDDTHRRWLDEARQGMPEFIDKVQREYNATRLEMLRGTGRLRIEPLTEDERSLFRTASQPARDAYRKQAGKRGGRILDRVTELTSTIEP